MRVVAKFGGTSVGTGQRVTRAAESIAEAVDAGHEVAVVASAMGGTTDRLLSAIEFDANEADRAEIVSMGERTAVRMLKGALDAQGIDAVFLEPGDAAWPILTDAYGEVDSEATRKRARACTDLLDDGVVPVITGFLAEDYDGNVTTLGRGGSDTTAVMLGNYLDADEVVIVTDVEGVMTGDPSVVEGARNVGEISVDEIRSLSFRGAEVIAPSALTYKTDEFGVRVVHHQHGDLLSGGTTVEGEFENLIDLQERELTCITVAGRAIRNQPGILASLSSALAEAEINVEAVSSGMDSLTFYTDVEEAESAEALVHEQVVDDEVMSSVTVESTFAVIRITGGDLPQQSGSLHGLLEPMASEHINLNDVITSATSVSVFVDWEERDRALELLQDLF
ncbi:aspartate kinase [Halovenus aranensis]|jgi:aspartate kinase|uniref:Aspartokinase n=1 Tax=Halovenus aranensis TaxID=890420 RepID=A0A1G8XLK4_9EURY|nr:aspartate kinase [Halovenus aranensis]SDJ90775.1 aspartate kinase [Halovenus aranensis]